MTFLTPLEAPQILAGQITSCERTIRNLKKDLPCFFKQIIYIEDSHGPDGLKKLHEKTDTSGFVGRWDRYLQRQVCDFLETLGLEASLRETFQREAIDGRVLCEMSDEDLSGQGLWLEIG